MTQHSLPAFRLRSLIRFMLACAASTTFPALAAEQSTTASAETPPAVLRSIKVQATDEASVATEGSGSYKSDLYSLGKGQAWLEIPQSVSIITNQRIEDQALVTVADVLAQTPGITATAGRGGEPEFFYARGFEVGSVQIDGISTGGGFDGNFFNPNLAMYDHVEVIRGADGLNAGTGEPGGSINFVRKRAARDAQLNFNASAGRWDNYLLQADLSGSLLDEGRVRGRLVASYNDREYFYDLSADQTKLGYGIVEADLGDSTLLSAGGSFERRDRKANYAGLLRFTDGSSTHLPLHTALAPTWNDGDFETRELFARIEHRFNDDWTLETSYTDMDREGWELVGGVGGMIDPLTRSGAYTYAWDYGYLTRRKSFDAHVNGTFEALGRRHAVLFGIDRMDQSSHQYYDTVEFAEDMPDIDVFNYDPASFPAPTGTHRTYDYGPWGSKLTSAYAKVVWQLLEPLKLTLGGRYSRFEYEDITAYYEDDGSLGWNGAVIYEDNGIFTPYGGLIYSFAPTWMAYASVSQIDKSQASYRRGPPPGTPLDPIEGRSFEMGVKGELAEGALQTSFAVYRIERTGEAVTDPAYPPFDGELGSTCCSLAQGKIVSKGFEAEVAGQVLPGWQLSAGYAFNESRNVEEGDVVYSSVTPRHSLRFWNGWQFQGRLSALRMGLGATVQSRAYETGISWETGNPYRTLQGGYAVWNALAEYRLNDNWSLALNGNNLLDKRYNIGIGQRDQVDIYGNPRNFVLSIRGRL